LRVAFNFIQNEIKPEIDKYWEYICSKPVEESSLIFKNDNRHTKNLKFTGSDMQMIQYAMLRNPIIKDIIKETMHFTHYFAYWVRVLKKRPAKSDNVTFLKWFEIVEEVDLTTKLQEEEIIDYLLGRQMIKKSNNLKIRECWNYNFTLLDKVHAQIIGECC